MDVARWRSGGMRAAALLGLLMSCVLHATHALAHTTRLSSADIALGERSARVVLNVNGLDLQAALGKPLMDDSGAASAARLDALREPLATYLGARTRILNTAGGSCASALQSAQPDREHVRLTLDYQCPPMTGSLVYQTALFHEIDPATRQMVTVRGAAARVALLSVASPRVELGATAAGTGEVLLHYFLAGVEHIGEGYDHIAFIVAVILWGRRIWRLAAVVTAFTVAHSITLTLAVLDVVSIPSRWVELAIALSIMFVALENFRVRDLRRRWIETFAFGLVHGLGFASALREYGIPKNALAPALAAFNVGVEAGQLVIVTGTLVVLVALERTIPALQPAPSARLVYPLSAVIAIAGAAWTVSRLVS